MKKSVSEEPILAFALAREWNAWLTKHHATAAGVLLRIAKKGATPSITYEEAIELALAWGWIDSQRRGLDDTAYLQRFSSRNAQSPWSKINCGKAEALIAAGTMKAPGLAEVERAKADGRWERAYDGARTITVPEDLKAALAKNAAAKRFFEALDGANRYAILWRLQTAKKAETRAARLALFVDMCARGATIHVVGANKVGAKKKTSAKAKAKAKTARR